MANKITEIKERVLQIAKYHGVSYEKFSNEIGMSYASFKGKAKFTPLNSDAIANNYHYLSRCGLLLASYRKWTNA